MDKYQNLQALTDKQLCELSKPCVFTVGTRKVKEGEAYRCKKGHITFMSQTGIENVFASMRAMKRKDARFTISVDGEKLTMKTGTYDFQARKTKGLLDKLCLQEKTKPCAVCFATTKCMGTNRADLDSLMTACPVSLLVKEEERRKVVKSKAKKKGKRKILKEEPVKKNVTACMFGKTCARLVYGKDCKSGCPLQQKYERQMAQKLWQENIQKEMEEAAAAQKLREMQEKEKQKLQEKKKREKEIRRRNFFATRIQKMARGYIVRKNIKPKAEVMWYTDLLKDLPKSGNWDDILHQLTLVEFDSEELLRDASHDELIEALKENNFRLRLHKAKFLLKKINERNDFNLLPLKTPWGFMKPGPPPGF